MMSRVRLLAAVGAAALTGVLATGYVGAQDAPESLLPPGFDDPAPAPTPAAPQPSQPTAAPQPGTGTPTSPQPGGGAPVIQPLPGGSELPPVPTISSDQLAELPSLEELEAMSTDELDDLLGLTPRYDIPPAARRSLTQVGLLSPEEGGLPTASLARQPAGLVRAILAGTDGPLVSRWGHILLRRALVSRLAAPEGMNPVEFAALRASLLNRMGEYPAARAIAQDVDTGNWNAALTDAALEAYIASADFVGACPAVRFQRSAREDAQWVMWQAICNAYAGEGALAGTQLDRALGNEIAPPIDVLLAQRFAGAAGRGRRAVEIEWEGIDQLTPWRFALANAVGEPIPEGLLADVGAYYQRSAATGAMVPLAQRAQFADLAASEGILSAHAMVDLYSQIYADDGIAGDPATRAGQLRQAYIGADPEDRLAAMEMIWGEGAAGGYGRLVMTAYAAARLPASSSFADQSGQLVASMLAAGLDRDALAWADVVPEGSLGWGLIALSQAERGAGVTGAQLDSFFDDDTSAEQRRSQFLVAGLAGLDRIGQTDLNGAANDLGVDLNRQTRWTRTISQAAEYENRALVAMLAGLGMQGSSWEQMTPLHLYHVVSALNEVGMGAEARMIAAEAVARS